jgi:hypothetical protein
VPLVGLYVYTLPTGDMTEDYNILDDKLGREETILEEYIFGKKILK